MLKSTPLPIWTTIPEVYELHGKSRWNAGGKEKESTKSIDVAEQEYGSMAAWQLFPVPRTIPTMFAITCNTEIQNYSQHDSNKRKHPIKGRKQRQEKVLLGDMIRN